MTGFDRPEQVPPSHPLAVHCERHGVTAYALLCRHLAAGAGLGYFAIPPEPEEPAQAWCEACDEVVEAEQGWTDRADAQADWRLYCAGCYAGALARHTLLSWVEGTSPDE
jgi:hypothetical protein